jgi:energy-coupling factor transporter ATP-binding protein EcfA2
MKIDISHPKKEFENHLEIEGNKRIIFSGPFGIGKTTFIKEFSEINKEKYNVIHLFPVNYSVSSNEDIFELIKYDLFYEILKFKPIVDDTLISELDYLPFFTKQEFHKLIHIFLSAIPKIGKPISEVLKDLDSLVGKFKEEHKALNKTEFDHISSFIKEMTESTGSIYEFDFYSSLIKSLLENIKSDREEGEKTKENILVIDDLDRVDPDHLFRLLNVFAAHVDFDKEEDNKFGFEKVVFVLDIRNVHNIFTNRYGQDVDFSGYIDKFYSKAVFEFNIQDEIIKRLGDLFKSIATNKSHIAKFDNSYNSITSGVDFLIRALVLTQSLNLRSLLKLSGLNYKEVRRKIELSRASKQSLEDASQLNFPLIIEFLKFVFGSSQGLEIGLQRLVKVGRLVLIIDGNNTTLLNRVSDLIPFLEMEEFPFNDHYFENKTYRYDNSKMRLSFDYTLIRDDYRYSARVQKVFDIAMNFDRGEEIKEFPIEAYFELLWEAYEVYRKSIR